MKALVLAGGFPQIALIEELRSRGVSVVLADYSEKPVAAPYADRFYRVSTLDVDGIEQVARDERVDLVTTVCTDQALLTVALVSQRLDLPCYIDYLTALNVTNKAHMKRVFVENNIPTAKHVVVDGTYMKAPALESLHYPLVVKPVDCNSSKGVRRVRNAGELERALVDACALSRAKQAVVEEYVEGIELSVDAYVEDGVARVLSISTSEKIADGDKFVIFRGNYPAEGIGRLRSRISALVQRIADAFGLKNSPMLVQIIRRGEDLYVLEFSARTGGGAKYLMVKKASGFDVIKAVVDLTLGGKPRVADIREESRFITNEFIYCWPGTFDHVEGFDELKARGVISEYFLFKWRGYEVKDVASSGDRVCGFTIQADSKDEMARKHKEAVCNIKVIDAAGRDIMRRDLMPDLHC
jgi:biotin carboxylase